MPLQLGPGRTELWLFEIEMWGAEEAQDVGEARQIHASMCRSKERYLEAAQERQMQPVDMGVDHVKWPPVVTRLGALPSSPPSDRSAVGQGATRAAIPLQDELVSSNRHWQTA